MSLTKCFAKLGLDPNGKLFLPKVDRRDLMEHAATYREKGMSKDEAELQAVRDRFEELRKEEGRISAEVADAWKKMAALPLRDREVSDVRVTKDGKIFGAPEGRNTAADRTALVRNVAKIIEDPMSMHEKSAEWYEESGREVARLTRGVRKLTEQVVRLMALYSQGNSIGGNTTATIKSMIQIAEGKTPAAGRFPGTTSQYVQALLDANEVTKEIPGINDKILNFYRNLIDPATGENRFPDAVTLDRWMTRLFGYKFSEDEEVGGRNNLSPVQYAYGRDVVDRVIDAYERKSGTRLLPRQLQAVLWTYIKNSQDRDAFDDQKTTMKTNIAALKVLGGPDSLKTAAALQKKLDAMGEFEPTTMTFVEYLRRATAVVTWETVPGTESGILPGIYEASEADRAEYTRATRAVMLDADGNDELLKKLHLSPMYSDQYSVGSFAGSLNPNVITGVVLPGGGTPNTKIADAWASGVGYVYSQSGMLWHRADSTLSKKDTTAALSVLWEQPTTPAFDKAFYDHIQKNAPGVEFTKIGDNEHRFLNIKQWSSLTDEQFHATLEKAVSTFKTDNTFVADQFPAQAQPIDGGTNGQGYLSRLSEAGFARLQDWLDLKRAQVHAINAAFSKRFGWGSPDGQEAAKESRQVSERRSVGVGMPRAELQAHVAEITKGWKPAFPIRVIARADAPFRTSEDAQGAFHDGSVYLFHDNIPNKYIGEFTLLHEVMGHYGMRGVLGARMTPVMNQIYRSNDWIARAADIWAADPVNQQKRGSMTEAEWIALATEEAMSDVAASEGLQGRLPTINGWDKFISAIRNILRSLGFTLKMTDQDIAALLAASNKFVVEGGNGRTEGAMQPAMSDKAPTYYSELLAKLTASQQKTGTGDQWKGMIKNMAGVKPAEIEEVGLMEWLSLQSGKVSKEDILNFVRQNGVQINEVMKGVDEQINDHDRELAKYVEEAVADARKEFEAARQAAADKLEEQYVGNHYVDPFTDEDGNDRWGVMYAGQLEPVEDIMYDTEQAAQDRADKMNDDEIDDQRREAEQYLAEFDEAEVAYQAERRFDREFESDAEPQYNDAGLSTKGRRTGYREVLLTTPLKGERKYTEENVTLMTPEELVNYMGVSRTNDTSMWFFKAPDTIFQVAKVHYPTAEAAKEYILAEKQPRASFFKGNHWGEKNIVAHTRWDERNDIAGNKVLMVQEIQSDWAQVGRSHGFQGPEHQKVLDELNQKIGELDKDIENSRSMVAMLNKSTSDAAAQLNKFLDEYKVSEIGLGSHRIFKVTRGYDTIVAHDAVSADAGEARDSAAKKHNAEKYNSLVEFILAEANKLTEAEAAKNHLDEKRYDLVEKIRVNSKGNQVPNAPFVKNTAAWSMLAMKRIIRFAAENGMDKIAWTTGAQQTARYAQALQDKVDTIKWTKTPEGIQIVGLKDRRKVVDTTQKETALSDAIGKTMADTIINDPTQSGTITGSNITISDTGMAGFYDRILPAEVNKYIKKWGSKVETVLLPDAAAKDETYTVTANFSRSNDAEFRVVKDGNTVSTFKTHGQAVGYATYMNEKEKKTPPAVEQHGFTITPEMRDSVLRGQPLFSRDRESPEFKKWFDAQLEASKQRTPEEQKAIHEVLRKKLSEERARMDGVVNSAELRTFSSSLGERVRDRAASMQAQTATWKAQGLLKRDIGDVVISPSHGYMMKITGYVPVDVRISRDPAKRRDGNPGYYVTYNDKNGEVKTTARAVILDTYPVIYAAKLESRSSYTAMWDHVRKAPVIGNMTADIFDNDKTLSPWMKTVGTQYHKAVELAKAGLPEFKRVFDIGQQFIADISSYAVKAEAQAPDLFRKINGLGDVFNKNRANTADIKKIAAPLFDGTLDGGADPMMGRVWTDAELVSKYNLSPKQINLYKQALAAASTSLRDFNKSIIGRTAKDVRVAYNSDLDMKAMAADVKKNINAALKGKMTNARRTTLEQALVNIDEATAKTENLIAHGYFPLKRFGEYTVTSKDEQGAVDFFEMFATQSEADAMANELRAQGRAVTQGVMSKKQFMVYGGLNLDAVQMFAKHMNAEHTAAYQEYLKHAINNRSSLKQLIRRKGIEGYSKQVDRVLAQFILSNARHASTQFNMGDMRKAVDSIDQKHGDVKDEAITLMEYLSNPQEEAAALRGFLFFNFIGGSIASAAVNLTQVPMMTAPFLTQFTSVSNVLSAIMGASRMAFMDPKKMGGAAGDALRKAESEGVTAPQEVHQMTAVAADRLFASNPKVNAALNAWSMAFQTAEVFNRRTTFLAAFKIGMDNGMGTDAAYEFAKDAMVQTQGIYNKGNRPNWGRGAIGATVFTFKQFSVMYLEMLKRMPMKQRLMMIGLMTLAAGVQGLPFADDLNDLIDTLGQWFGFNTNAKKFIAKSFGDGPIGQFALNGISSVLPINIQGRMGMANLLPGTAILKQSETDKGHDVAEVLGPVGSLVKSAGDALQGLATARMEQVVGAASPVAFKNAYKGFEAMQDGYLTDDKGRKVADLTTGEAIAKVIGFNPSSVADASEKRQYLRQDQALLQVRTQEIINNWVDGLITNNADKVMSARKELMRWNTENRETPIIIRPATLRQKIIEARLTADQRFVKALPKGLKAEGVNDLILRP